jgi:hypothetical protein
VLGASPDDETLLAFQPLAASATIHSKTLHSIWNQTAANIQINAAAASHLTSETFLAHQFSSSALSNRASQFGPLPSVATRRSASSSNQFCNSSSFDIKAGSPTSSGAYHSSSSLSSEERAPSVGSKSLSSLSIARFNTA